MILDPSTGMPLEQESIQANNNHNHQLYFTPAPKTEQQRQQDALIESQQTLAVGTVVDYRIFVKSAVVDTDTALPDSGDVPSQPGITPQYTITCANVGSTTVGMTCTMPGAGTLQPGGVTCKTVPLITTSLPARIRKPNPRRLPDRYHQLNRHDQCDRHDHGDGHSDRYIYRHDDQRERHNHRLTIDLAPPTASGGASGHLGDHPSHITAETTTTSLLAPGRTNRQRNPTRPTLRGARHHR